MEKAANQRRSPLNYNCNDENIWWPFSIEFGFRDVICAKEKHILLLCMQAAKALMSMCIFTGSLENVMLYNAISTRISHAGSYTNTPKHVITTLSVKNKSIQHQLC